MSAISEEVKFQKAESRGMCLVCGFGGYKNHGNVTFHKRIELIGMILPNITN